MAIANDFSYGLAGSVWTDDPERGLKIARRARVGTFGVNLHVPDIGAPWGRPEGERHGQRVRPGRAAHVPGDEMRVPPGRGRGLARRGRAGAAAR